MQVFILITVHRPGVDRPRGARGDPRKAHVARWTAPGVRCAAVGIRCKFGRCKIRSAYVSTAHAKCLSLKTVSRAKRLSCPAPYGALRVPPAGTLSVKFTCHRRSATKPQIVSITPNGQEPCRKPYADPSQQDKAKARMNQGYASPANRLSTWRRPRISRIG